MCISTSVCWTRPAFFLIEYILLKSNILLSACIREHNVIYGGNIISQVTVGNMQDCADLCAQMKEGLFWTFKNKTCTLRNSIEGRGGHGDTTSGNRECGLFPMRGWDGSIRTLQPEAVTVGSQRTVNSSADQCADGNTGTFCTVAASPAPWLALDFGKRTQVNLTALPS